MSQGWAILSCFYNTKIEKHLFKVVLDFDL